MATCLVFYQDFVDYMAIMQRLAGLIGSLAIGLFMGAAGLAFNIRELVIGGMLLFGLATVLWLVPWGRKPSSSEVVGSAASKVDQSVTSHNQSGGITAHIVHTKPAQRSVEDAWGQQIIRDLSNHPMEAVYQVGAATGDKEAYQLAVSVRDHMLSSGHQVSDTICAISSTVPLIGHNIGQLRKWGGEPFGPIMVQIGSHPDS